MNTQQISSSHISVNINNKLLIYAYVKTQQIPTYVYVQEQGFLNKITIKHNGFLTYVYAYL